MSNSEKKILLIEDDPLIVEIYETRLKKAGFRVESVPDGKKAFRKLKEKEFDLLLLDIVLPSLTGFELLTRIRNDDELKDIRVLVLSNLGEKTDVERAEKLGVVGYLIKAHHTPSDVVEEIEKILED